MIEEQLQTLIDVATVRQLRYSEVIATCTEAINEIERLREYEFMYQSCSK